MIDPAVPFVVGIIAGVLLVSLLLWLGEDW